MPEDQTATLRDVTVDPTPNPAPAATTQEPTPAPTPAVSDTDAAEIGRIMLESGFGKDRINEVLQAPGALQSIRYLIQNDPKEFLSLVERSDSRAGENLLETLADEYVKRYAPKGDAAGGKKAAADPNSGLMAEIEALKGRVSSYETKEQQRENNAALAQVRARYDARVEDLFNQEGVKKLGLTKSEARAMRADLDKTLAADPNIVQRTSLGNFVDVPRTFQRILEDWGNDRKEAAEAAKRGREGVGKNSFPDFSNGAQPFMVDVPADAADSWEGTESALAKAMERMTGGR